METLWLLDFIPFWLIGVVAGIAAYLVIGFRVAAFFSEDSSEDGSEKMIFAVIVIGWPFALLMMGMFFLLLPIFARWLEREQNGDPNPDW